MEKLDCIYHGCFRKNQDGTNRIIANNEACLLPTNNQFWKHLEHVPSGIKTRSQYKKQDVVTIGTFERYLRQKNRDNIQRWLEADNSEVRLFEESDKFYLVC